MDAREAMRAAGMRKLWEAVREVAESGAPGDDDQAKCGDRDASACADAVQEQDKSSDSYSGNRDKRDANRHWPSVNHVRASSRRTRAPRPKPMKKP
jgi:hypothetical protein